MIKSFIRFARFTVVGILWTYVFVFCANMLMHWLWNFNIFSARSWQTISFFWESGGIIQGSKDYIFFLMLVFLPFVWIFGWRYFLKISYINILLYPINAYNKSIIEKYGKSSPRVVLKNIKSTQKMVEEIKSQLDSIKPKEAKEVRNIRQYVNQTISEEIKQD